jgi:phenylacetate-coenzyme A ligase PaaK-like adenylate-forming protein
MKDFPYASRISEIENPLDWTPQKCELFILACREMAVFHQKNSRDIAFIYKRHGFDPDSLRTEADLERIPAVGVTAMKHFLMTSLPHDQAVLKLTSSGTRGQKTQIWLDQASLDRVQRMIDVYLEQEKLVSSNPTNYLVFNYDPDDAKDLGIAYTEKNQMRFAPIAGSYFAIKKNAQGQWVFHKEEALRVFKSYIADNKPIRILAMPAFLHEFLNFLKETGEGPFKPQLPDQCLILTGGGWKAAEDKKITREQFRTLCEELLGIPSACQRDAYGMAEHCAPYFECREHRLHVAVFNRIIIRDPVTLAPCPNGQAGLMELITPFNAMMPTLAILSTDYGLIAEEPCPCGFRSPTFTILGRAGLSKHKGCAISASDIVKRGA